MDDREYKAFQEYKEMADKHNYLWESKGGTEEQKIIRDMAVFAAFGEGLLLKSSLIMMHSRVINSITPNKCYLVSLSFSSFRRLKSDGY